jgi:ATP-dependent Zn protease
MASSTNSIVHVRKKFHSLHDLISTSYHEAGHTIYGLLHGMNVESVQVFENKKTKRIDGITYYNPPELDEIQDEQLKLALAESEVCLCYAGLISEKKLFKSISGLDSFPMFLKNGSSTDIAEALSIIIKFNLAEPGLKRYQYKKKLIKKINQELTEHWDAVTAVAHSLNNKKRINFFELKELLIKKTNHREFWKQKFKIQEKLYINRTDLDEIKIKSILLP